MEEHLNDKNRIVKEWEGLNAYVPDICRSDVGKQTANASKNRYSDVLPCKCCFY